MIINCRLYFSKVISVCWASASIGTLKRRQYKNKDQEFKLQHAVVGRGAIFENSESNLFL